MTHFNELNLVFVPVIKTIKAGDLKGLSDGDVPKSVYYNGQAEGVVLKNYNTQTMAKHVTSKFKEVNRDTFGRSKKFAEDDSEVLVCKYCTNPRIDKCIFKLVDDGEKLEMRLMEKLPRMVNRDIFDEHGFEIYDSRLKVDFGKFRKLVMRRCLAVLKQVMVNNSLEGGK